MGAWTIDRDLVDLRTGLTGHFEGTLAVRADAAGYEWSESGTLSWGEYTGRAERSLLLRVREGEWWVCFTDGRPFHPWRVGGEVVHPCRADVYRGLIERGGADPDRFTITWQVTGSDKRQRIVSRMTRQAADRSATSTPSTPTSRTNPR